MGSASSPPTWVRLAEERPCHQEATSSIYANLACKATLTPLLDFALLSCAEIDTDFNVNTGQLRRPLRRRDRRRTQRGTLQADDHLHDARRLLQRRGQSYPSIRERVNTVTMRASWWTS